MSARVAASLCESVPPALVRSQVGRANHNSGSAASCASLSTGTDALTPLAKRFTFVPASLMIEFASVLGLPLVYASMRTDPPAAGSDLIREWNALAGLPAARYFPYSRDTAPSDESS